MKVILKDGQMYDGKFEEEEVKKAFRHTTAHILAQAVKRTGRWLRKLWKEQFQSMDFPYVVNEGDGAFYGPKLDFHLQDSIGRTWQCGTIQLDFQLPIRFEAEYTGADGEKHRPIMIHRVVFGSIERFIGILIEHYAGKFPFWLAPVQVKVLPISDRFMDYAKEVTESLSNIRLRSFLYNLKCGC